MALPELLASLTAGQLWSASIAFFLGSFLVDFLSHPKYPKDIPLMGLGPGKWNKFIDSFRYLTNFKNWVCDGYNKYGKKGVAFVAPSPFSRPGEIVIPRSQISWMLDLPDNIVGTYEAHNTVLYSEYSFLGKRFAMEPFPHRVMHKYLARHLQNILPDIEDEINHAVDEAFGNDTENWKSVNVWDTWFKELVPHITNRLLVGPVLCRDKQFIDGVTAFTEDIVRNTMLLQVFPKIMLPVVGRLVSIPNYFHWRKANARIQPFIEERLNAMTKQAANDPEFKDYVPPEDFITWAIRLALAEGRTIELDPITLSKRILPIQFAALHTTVLTGMLWTLDLLQSDPDTGILDILREEIKANKPESGPWTKVNLANLVRVDSSIRESQRYSSIGATLVQRQVVAENGLYNPDLGWTLPKGSFLTVNMQGTHHDADLYEDPDTYKPLRYSTIREAWDAKSEEEKKESPEEGTRARALGMVTTSGAHLAFGHGRHACPGRFFVAHELKLILVHTLLNYDIRINGKVADKMWIGANMVPAMGARIEVRRKKAVA